MLNIWKEIKHSTYCGYDGWVFVGGLVDDRSKVHFAEEVACVVARGWARS